MINSFRGKHAFLSNFHLDPPVYYLDRTWKCSEYAYQAAKSDNPDDWDIIESCKTPMQCKKAGNSLITVSSRWDDARKIKVMLDILRVKFSTKKYIDKLLLTGSKKLIEGNWWHDNFWGNCTCPNCSDINGKNMLGRLLMQVREERLVLQV